MSDANELTPGRDTLHVNVEPSMPPLCCKLASSRSASPKAILQSHDLVSVMSCSCQHGMQYILVQSCPKILHGACSQPALSCHGATASLPFVLRGVAGASQKEGVATTLPPEATLHPSCFQLLCKDDSGFGCCGLASLQSAAMCTPPHCSPHSDFHCAGSPSSRAAAAALSEIPQP